MSAAHSLFKTHALAELQAGDTAAALTRVNYPVGQDLQGTDYDVLRVWSWFRDAVGELQALRVRAAVEQIVAQKPATLDEQDVANQQAFAFATNAQSLLSRLDSIGVSPCDPELRRALTTVIQMSADQSTVEAFTAVLQLGYQSLAEAVLGREATSADFFEAVAVHQAEAAEITYDREQFTLTVNKRHDGRVTMSCRLVPIALVAEQIHRGDAVVFEASQAAPGPQQQLAASVMTAVNKYLEAIKDG